MVAYLRKQWLTSSPLLHGRRTWAVYVRRAEWTEGTYCTYATKGSAVGVAFHQWWNIRVGHGWCFKFYTLSYKVWCKHRTRQTGLQSYKYIQFWYRSAHSVGPVLYSMFDVSGRPWLLGCLVLLRSSESFASWAGDQDRLPFVSGQIEMMLALQYCVFRLWGV